jgi:threonine/homoserine/homoserine lactone efflux protein
MCSIGIALGLSIHIIYSALGLAAIIANSSITLWVIKILGGTYLIYLGIQGIRSKACTEVTKGTTEKIAPNMPIKRSSFKNIGIGFLCNALNPKAPIYFVALFTVVLSPDLPFLHLVIYGLWMMAIQLAWFSSVVLLLSRPKINEKFQRLGHWIDRILGGAMIFIGLKILTSKIN